MSERIEGVGHRHDAGGQRNGLALESGAIAGAVPVLMVIERDPFRHLQESRRAAGQNLRADQHMGFHGVEFLAGQLPGSAQNFIRDSDLADVVERRCQADQLGIGAGHS